MAAVETLDDLRQRIQLGPRLRQQIRVDRRLSRSDVDDDHLVELVAVSAFDPAMAGQELLALDDQTPNLRELLAQVARPVGVKSPRYHIPLPVLKLLLSIAPVARFLNSKPEALDFIQTTRFDTTALEQFAKRHGIAKPDIALSVQHTARFVNLHYAAKGQAR